MDTARVTGISSIGSAASSDTVEPTEWAWAAGFLCALGTFTLHEGRPLLIVKSSRDRDSVQHFADIIKANANICRINGKPGLRVTVSGDRLHKVMKGLWPYLSRVRKKTYLGAKSRAENYALMGRGVREKLG